MTKRVLNTYQYTVGTGAANAIGVGYPASGAEFRSGRDLTITNLSTNTVFFGVSTVTVSNGAAIPANTVFPLRDVEANVFVVAISAGSVITVSELI